MKINITNSRYKYNKKEVIKMQTKKALLVVDIQNDFCPGGALGVCEGDQIIPVVNKYVKLFLNKQFPS